MNQKVIDVYNGMVTKFKELIHEHELNHDDYEAMVNWLNRLGKAGEVPLFMDVFFETHALQEMYKNVKGTEPTILGPYYLKDSPKLTAPYVLPMRSDEPGEILFFSGTIKDVDGNPLGNTVVDMWQADASGEYSGFAEGIPTENSAVFSKQMPTGTSKCKQSFQGIIQSPPTGQLVSF